MEVGRLYLDANIFILLGEGQGETALVLTELATATRPNLVTSELTLAEVLVKPYRDRDEVLIGRYEDWILRGGFVETVPVETITLRYAALIRAQYRSIKLPDAIHSATAIGCDCSHVLSADTRLPERIEVRDDRRVATQGLATIDIIRPDPPVLRSILEAQTKT